MDRNKRIGWIMAALILVLGCIVFVLMIIYDWRWLGFPIGAFFGLGGLLDYIKNPKTKSNFYAARQACLFLALVFTTFAFLDSRR